MEHDPNEEAGVAATPSWYPPVWVLEQRRSTVRYCICDHISQKSNNFLGCCPRLPDEYLSKSTGVLKVDILFRVRELNVHVGVNTH